MATLLATDEEVSRLLAATRTIAVLGAHVDDERAARYVPDYLARAGFRIVPVNPRFHGQRLYGEEFRDTLAEVGPIDLVDVFRRPQCLPEHLDDLLAARPKAVWFQSGIVNDAVANALVRAGIDVVQDRCLMVEHRRLGPR